MLSALDPRGVKAVLLGGRAATHRTHRRGVRRRGCGDRGRQASTAVPTMATSSIALPSRV